MDFLRLKTTKMKYLNLLTLVVIFLLISCSQPEKKAVDYVNPFIATQGDHGHWLPAALAPFGLVELCPDTYPGSLTADGDFAHSGYDFSDSQIRGFSHFHRGSSGGGGIKDRAGQISILPFTGVPAYTFYTLPVVDIDKNTEVASPGYYSVFLPKNKILTELTATGHVGFHKYQFPGNKNAKIILNSGRKGVLSCSLVNNKRIEGNLGSKYFVIEFDSPVIDSKIWNGSELTKNNSADKKSVKALVCDFGELQGKPLLIKAGFSLTGIDAAEKNMNGECPEWDFDKTKVQTSELWNEKLSKIKVEGDTEYKIIFYTALYHTSFLPNIINDIDGIYPGLDGQMHKAEGYSYYENYAFWDSFRTKYPLFSLYMPGNYSDIVKSLRDIYEQADNAIPFPDNDHPPHGILFSHKGKNGYHNYSTCRHEHMLMVMTDAYIKGLFGFELESVYPFIRREIMWQMHERYDSIGYIPARPDQTGEYSWDNWCVAQLAKSIGNQEDYEYFLKRSEFWKNTWSSEQKNFQARAADGTWLDYPEDPTVNREKYTYEGTAWQYRWNVLHDVPGLIEVLGGKKKFVDSLSYFFENDLYTAGNQIDLHAPFLFNSADAPWETQKWVRTILTEPITQRYATHNFFAEPIFDQIYKNTPDGYLEEMDGDYGCMAAWYAMSAMGIYQICPGDPVYQITAPIFDKVTIYLDQTYYKGKEFCIEAKGLSKENFYIQSATLNGEPLNRSWLSHDEITAGGELIFEMGNEPNKKWGIDSE
jgi:predicted alpha-1,2-mannosidase